MKLRKVTSQMEGETNGEEHGQRVRVFGRVHRARKQKDMLFMTLRDGYGFLQCILTEELAKCYEALTLTLESAIEIVGEMQEVPPGAHAPDNRELHADYFRVIPYGKAAGGDEAITNRVSKDTDPSVLLDLRHFTLRGETASALMMVRDAVEWAFNQTYHELRIRKVSPHTQSSQLYLETCLPSLGDVYCIEKSFRAEKSLTRRHLAEYFEAELDFITFDDLLNHLEFVICRVLEIALADPAIEAHVKRMNPEFEMPTKPFMRMKYEDAIKWLNEHDILNEEGNPHEFGDDIAEAAERKMTDEINRPIFLTHFPVEIKAFYMMKGKDDKRVTESVDCLFPSVGEIVGGSMRIYDYDELMAAYEREKLDPSPYYWYTDQRKYGGSPHGGYGLGFERFLAWLCKQHTIRDTCLYPGSLDMPSPVFECVLTPMISASSHDASRKSLANIALSALLAILCPILSLTST